MASVKRDFDKDGVRYYYSVSADPRNPGQYSYGVQVFVLNSRNIPVSDGSAFTGSISGTINQVVAKLQRNISELEQSAATQQETLAGLEQQLQNPNLTPAERAAIQARIDDFKAGTIAETQDAIAGNQRAIAELQNNSTAIFQDMQQALDAELVPPPATPTIDDTEAPDPADPAGNNALQGAASDDSGSQPTTPTSESETAAGSDSSDTGPTDEPSINAPEQPGTEREVDGEEDNSKGTPPYENETFDRAKTPPGDRPGKRLKNPLGSLASYTYQLSLYMISPDAYDAFIASGRRNIDLFNEQFVGSIAAENVTDLSDRGVFLVAQSGGSSPTDRTPEFKYDYYIDDLSFRHLVNSKATGGSVGNIDFNFRITEPYGFSLITNLKKAQDRIRNTSTNNPTKQFFMLGIRFYGWDQDGTQVTGKEIRDGNPLDVNSRGTGAIFETFYDLVVSEIKFKIDGKASVYQFKAVATSPAYSVNLRKGMVNTSIEAYGSTVREMLSGPKGLITLLNKEQQKLKENGTINIPTVYKINWVGDSEQIATASVVSETRTNKSTQSAGQAKNTDEVNPDSDTTASPNSNQERLNFSNVPIIQAIDQVIARSKYIEDAMVKNYTDANEADTKTNSFPADKSPNKKFTWFRITPEISNIKWDEAIKDWAFVITYKINTYLVPVIDNPYVQNNVKYYGPHKRYDYWYTGQNSEIISYTQELNNTYFTNVLGGGGVKNTNLAQPGNQEGNASSVEGQGPAVLPNTPTPGDNNGAQGTLNMAAVNSVRTTLYDPGSFATAKISILGDPDYLMQEMVTSSTGLNKAYSRFYEDNSFTINPTGGQVFIEIDFKEGVDYSTNEFNDNLVGINELQSAAGTLSINDSILFWDYNPEARKIIKGISYKLISVTSNFSKGAFTQQLSAVINDFGTKSALSASARQEEESESSAEPANEPESTNPPKDPSTSTVAAGEEVPNPQTAPEATS
jgi:hypothetical protein